MRTAAVLIAATLAAGLLAGCTAAGAGPTRATPPVAVGTEPARHPGADRPGPTADVPVRRAALPAADAVPAPAALRIDSLGIALPVEPVGVQADGQMEIPPQAEVAGWYRFGPAPGAPTGTTVIAAHVDSVASAGLGPFARLTDLAVGDVVSVTRADGAVLRYAVDAVERLGKPDVAWRDVFRRDGAHRLVLVTCGGVWHEDRRSYSDNVVVTAAVVTTDQTDG